MTALAEALTRFQSFGLTSVTKAYLADAITDEEAHALLVSFGCTDQVELQLLFAALDTMKRLGTQAPNGAPQSYLDRRESEPLTNPQRNRIERDCKDKGVAPPADFTGISKAQASEIVQSLADGTYDAERWTVPV